MDKPLFERPLPIKIIAAGMVISFLFFMFDVVLDLRTHLKMDTTYSSDELFHLFFEVLAVLASGAGILVMQKYINDLHQKNIRSQYQLKAIREDFDELVHQYFDTWQFTTAERDVALLLLRGLSILDIAQLRTTSTGTIKVQSHNIFKKSGVSSRVEFMSLFMDEFMDIGMNNGEKK